MSDILLCTTDGHGFTTEQWHFTQDYQVSSLVALKPDTLGLQAWEQYQNMDFSKYKLIWLHLNPRMMNPPWYLFPSLIKKRAPNTTLIIKHEWWEKYYSKQWWEKAYSESMMEIMKKPLRRADYFHTNTQIGKEILEENFNVPVLYYHLGQPRADYYKYPKSVPWEKREGILAIQHTSRDSMIRKFEIGKITGLPIVAINSVPDTDGTRLASLAEAVGADTTCYGRLSWEDFIRVVSECKVAIELDYVGICRLAYECAKVKVPIIGTNLAEYRNILYPSLTTEPGDVEGIAEKVLELYNGPEPKQLNRKAYDKMRRYWSKEACHRRLLKLFEEVGHEYVGS